MFDEKSIKKSYLLSSLLKTISEEFNCSFIDLNEFVNVSDVDGLHYNEDSHVEVAKLLHYYFVSLT